MRAWLQTVNLAGMRNYANVRSQVYSVFLHLSFSDVCCMHVGHDCIGSNARLVAGWGRQQGKLSHGLLCKRRRHMEQHVAAEKCPGKSKGMKSLIMKSYQLECYDLIIGVSALEEAGGGVPLGWAALAPLKCTASWHSMPPPHCFCQIWALHITTIHALLSQQQKFDDCTCPLSLRLCAAVIRCCKPCSTTLTALMQECMLATVLLCWYRYNVESVSTQQFPVTPFMNRLLMSQLVMVA